MKIIKWTVIVIVALLAVFLGVGMVLPGNVDVSRSIIIKAPPLRVWTHAATLRTWPDWTDWNTKTDPTLKYTYSGPDTGKGAKMAWTADSLGVGELEIVEAVPGESIKYTMSMKDTTMTIDGVFTFRPENGAVRATWTDTGKLGSNLVYKWMGLFMDSMLGGEFEANLARLKAWSEQEAK